MVGVGSGYMEKCCMAFYSSGENLYGKTQCFKLTDLPKNEKYFNIIKQTVKKSKTFVEMVDIYNRLLI